MDVIEASEVVTLPEQIVMMDKELGQRHPNKVFYLRVSLGNRGVDHVDLDGAVTPIHACNLARANGYGPTHWMEVGCNVPVRFA